MNPVLVALDVDSAAKAVGLTQNLLRGAAVSTVSLRQGPPKAPGKASRRFDPAILFGM